MTEALIRIEGRAGRITLNRPQALNALTPEMLAAIRGALIAWQENPNVALVLMDAVGDRAFCAGGDITQLYAAGTAGQFEFGRAFWRDEYHLNDLIARYAKPVIALMQGFTFGGGVGVGCHAQHRVVGETSKIAMPECTIGLLPDVGGSYLLARGPGHLGAYLGMTGHRMGPGDAIRAGFADVFVPLASWPALTAQLVETGQVSVLAAFAKAAPPAELTAHQGAIDTAFAAQSVAQVLDLLPDDDFGQQTRKAMLRNSPLAMACALEVQRRMQTQPTLRKALDLEYRYVFRAQSETDFLEGIRAAVIDKDRAPRWKHENPKAVTTAEVDHMLSPLNLPLTFQE